MTADLFLVVSENAAFVILTLAVALTLVRLLRGPTLPDRVLALDMLTMLAISLIGVIALRSGEAFELDIALALCLIGFVATAALARYVLSQPSPPAAEAVGKRSESP